MTTTNPQAWRDLARAVTLARALVRAEAGLPADACCDECDPLECPQRIWCECGHHVHEGDAVELAGDGGHICYACTDAGKLYPAGCGGPR